MPKTSGSPSTRVRPAVISVLPRHGAESFVVDRATAAKVESRRGRARKITRQLRDDFRGDASFFLHRASCSAAPRARAGYRGPSTRRSKQHLAQIDGSHCGDKVAPALLTGMIAAQRARDLAMAQSIENERRRRAVLIAGTGHVRADRGAPLYMRRRPLRGRIYRSRSRSAAAAGVFRRHVRDPAES